MKLCKQTVVLLVTSVLLSACATGSVKSVGDVAIYKSGSCEVTVYQDKNQAIKNGLTEAKCVIVGDSRFSFDHSIEGAIKNSIDMVCRCGVTKAYVAHSYTESLMGIKGLSHVKLVGFK